jgi:hypothetical protein
MCYIPWLFSNDWLGHASSISPIQLNSAYFEFVEFDTVVLPGESVEFCLGMGVVLPDDLDEEPLAIVLSCDDGFSLLLVLGLKQMLMLIIITVKFYSLIYIQFYTYTMKYLDNFLLSTSFLTVTKKRIIIITKNKS